MRSRREFIQLASVSAMLLATKSWSSVAAKQKLKTEDLLDFDKDNSLNEVKVNKTDKILTISLN